MKQFYFELARATYDKFLISPPHERNTCDPHIHKQMEILYIVKGCNRVSVNNNTVLLSENQMAIADSFDIHKWEHVSDTSILLIFPYAFLKPFILQKAGRKLSSNFILEPGICLQFKTLIDIMPQYSNDTKVIEGLVHAFIALLLKHIKLEKTYNKQYQTLLNDILMYIEDNFKQNLSLTDVANHFGYSKYHFSKLFNQLIGLHFDNYINMVRTNNVIFLLKEKDYSVTNAVFESGFSSLSTFYRVFKSQYNCSINSYLKSHKS